MIRKILNSKIFFLIKILLISLIVSLNLYANENDTDKSIFSIGSHEAKVKIKIFSSLTCPHCANFHEKIVPKIEKEYIRIY